MGMRTAERLREIAELVDGSSTLGDVMDVLTGRLGVVPDGEGRVVEDFHSFDSLVERLADLVESEGRSCRNTCDGRGFECSACGTRWHLLDRATPLDEWEHVRTPPGFCPSCGMKVVR